MYTVYILRSDSVRSKTYIGFTEDLDARIKAHNDGRSRYTAPFRPWSVAFHAVFPDKIKALAFESYLKSHSGKAFSHKRLL